MELKQRVNSSVKLLLLVLIEWSGGEGYGGDRSRVCEGCRRQFPLNLPQSYRSLITPSLAVGILLNLISPPGALPLFIRFGY